MKIYTVFISSLLLAKAFANQPCCFSDNGIFPPRCERLAEDQELFQNFKRDPLLSLFVENATEEEGRACLAKLPPDLIEKCRINDRLGNPRVVSYQKSGKFSPTTLRYAKIASDLEREFGSLNGFRVVEIGGGYGGLCTVLSSIFSFKNYTLVDLPQNLLLCERYLREQKIEHVSFVNLPDLPEGEEDLVISHFVFSESDRSLQKRYLDKVLSRAKAGFLICAPAHWKEIPYSNREHKRVKPFPHEKILHDLAQRGIEARVIPEEPLTGKDHCVIIWKR